MVPLQNRDWAIIPTRVSRQRRHETEHRAAALEARESWSVLDTKQPVPLPALLTQQNLQASASIALLCFYLFAHSSFPSSIHCIVLPLSIAAPGLAVCQRTDRWCPIAITSKPPSSSATLLHTRFLDTKLQTQPPGSINYYPDTLAREHERRSHQSATVVSFAQFRPLPHHPFMPLLLLRAFRRRAPITT